MALSEKNVDYFGAATVNLATLLMGLYPGTGTFHLTLMAPSLIFWNLNAFDLNEMLGAGDMIVNYIGSLSMVTTLGLAVIVRFLIALGDVVEELLDDGTEVSGFQETMLQVALNLNFLSFIVKQFVTPYINWYFFILAPVLLSMLPSSEGSDEEADSE